MAGVTPVTFTVRDMTSLVRLVRSAGNAGAVRDAYRACEERKLVEARLASRLETIASTTAERRQRVAGAA